MVKALLLAACASLLASCSTNSGPGTTPLAPDSLRFPTHTMFEQNDQPSLNGWIFHPAIPGDTAGFDRDAPPTGGTWSLKLHKADAPHGTNNVTQGFTNLTSGVYELTTWLKTKYTPPVAPANNGWIAIIKRTYGVSNGDTLLSGDSTNWRSISLFDTLTLVPTDSVILELSAAATDTTTHGNPLWFDDVTFQKIH